MPGNYELYEPSTNKLGPVICKACWERFGKQNPESLNTVWISLGGMKGVWWLCQIHTESLRSEGWENASFLRSSKGVVKAPEI